MQIGQTQQAMEKYLYPLQQKHLAFEQEKVAILYLINNKLREDDKEDDS